MFVDRVRPIIITGVVAASSFSVRLDFDYDHFLLVLFRGSIPGIERRGLLILGRLYFAAGWGVA
jgi:hypothetical protein